MQRATYQLDGSTKFRNCVLANGSGLQCPRICATRGGCWQQAGSWHSDQFSYWMTATVYSKDHSIMPKINLERCLQLEAAESTVLNHMRSWQVLITVLTSPLRNLSQRPLFLNHDITSGQSKAPWNVKPHQGVVGRKYPLCANIIP